MPGTPFETVTSIEVDPGQPGSYRGYLPDSWDAPILPHGGVVSAVALRAMSHALDEPDKRLRSVTTVFAAQVPQGPVAVDVSILRRGRAVSQATATIRTPGAEAGHTSLAVFGAERPGFRFTDVGPPEVPEPDSCPSMRDPIPVGIEDRWSWRLSTFWQHIEMRRALGHAPWEQWIPHSSESASWLRYDDPPVTDDGELDPLAVVALCDTMPGSVGERMGPNQTIWRAPSADLTVHLLGEATPGWLLAHKRARHADEGYASLELTLWSEERALIAYATQMMIFSFPDGPPSTSRPPG